MNADIRVSVSFRGHRKRKKLNTILGYDATGRLIDLWIGAAAARPDGKLTGWDRFDIGIESGMDSCTESEIDRYVSALILVGFLEEKDNGLFVLHDWLDHNMYASFSEKRSEKGVFNNLKRWHPDIAEMLKREGKSSITREEYKKLVAEKEGQREKSVRQESCTDPDPNPPSPNPSPNPNPNPKEEKSVVLSAEITPPAKNGKRFIPPSLEDVQGYCRERGNSVNAIKFHAHYESNGWRVGKNPMKSWKAAVIKWEEDDQRGSPQGSGGKATTYAQEIAKQRNAGAKRLKEKFGIGGANGQGELPGNGTGHVGGLEPGAPGGAALPRLP